VFLASRAVSFAISFSALRIAPPRRTSSAPDDKGIAVATAIRVECINKTDRTNPHERIRFIGGRNSDGTRWKMSQPDAIAAIEQGRWSFYVERPVGDSVWVVVAISAMGNKYLKTQADGDQPNNLLSLPECP
jgi:hypothetical protein